MVMVKYNYSKMDASALRETLAQVIAFVCGCIAALLLIISISCTAWLETNGYRQGLWEECNTVSEGNILCTKNAYTAWIIACGALSIVGLIISAVGTGVTGIALISSNPDFKVKLYRAAMYLMFFSILFIVIALIVFPVKFMQDLSRKANEKKQPDWYFGWAYGMAWGAAIFIFGAAVLLLIDKESEELYYREKTYYHNEADA